jgi:hypothetical protein
VTSRGRCRGDASLDTATVRVIQSPAEFGSAAGAQGGVLVCVASTFWICGRRSRLSGDGVGKPDRLGEMLVRVV